MIFQYMLHGLFVSFFNRHRHRAEDYQLLKELFGMFIKFDAIISSFLLLNFKISRHNLQTNPFKTQDKLSNRKCINWIRDKVNHMRPSFVADDTNNNSISY